MYSLSQPNKLHVWMGNSNMIWLLNLLNISDFVRSPISGLRTSIPSPRKTKFKGVLPRAIRIHNSGQWTSFSDTQVRQHYFSYKTLIMQFVSSKKKCHHSQTLTVIELLEDFVFFFLKQEVWKPFTFDVFSVYFGEKST